MHILLSVHVRAAAPGCKSQGQTVSVSLSNHCCPVLSLSALGALSALACAAPALHPCHPLLWQLQACNVYSR